MFAFRRFHAFFGIGFGTVGFLGFVLDASPLWLVPSLIVLGLPWLITAMTARSLEIPTRHHTPSTKHRPHSYGKNTRYQKTDEEAPAQDGETKAPGEAGEETAEPLNE
jgi:hypothetical protein